MLEGAVARILNQVLGKYVVDLDTENLNVGIFSGLVQLTDLKLKTEALYELRLPIQVRAGTIGKITLQIPWSSLWSQPIVVAVEDIHILCIPIVGQPFDAERNKRLLRGFKKQTLEAIANACSMIGGPGVFAEHLLTNIVNNIQLSVGNIHVRYECHLGDVPIAVGLCIGGISAENTNNKWKACPGYKSSDNLSYHLVKLEALCAYCNCEEKLPEWDFSTNNGYYAWKNAMANSLQNYSIENEFNFFVRPMSIKLKMTITKDHGQVKKISSDCIVHDLNVHVDKTQFETLLSLYDSLQRDYIAWEFIAFRPDVSFKSLLLKTQKTASWWHYAYTAVLKQRVHPYTWSQIKQTRQHAKHYTALYQQHLLNPNDTELKLDLQQYEDKLNLTNIIIARQEARLRVRTQSVQEKSFWDVLPSPEKQLLCERIGFVEFMETSFTHPNLNIEYEYNFRVGNTCVALTNENEREVVVLTLTQIIGSYRPNFGDQRDKIEAGDREKSENRGGKRVCSNLPQVETGGGTRKLRKRDKGALKIEGIIIEGANEKEHLVPIISSNHEGHDSPAYFLRVDFERFPDSGKRILEEEIIRMRVNFVLEQLEVAYDKYAYEQITNYFEKNHISWPTCQSYLAKWPKKLLQEMDKRLLDNWDFNVVFNFPYFVVPEKGQPLNSNQSPVLILDLGQLKLSTELCRPSLIADNATQMELEEQMYSKYHLELKGQQILLALNEKDNWKAAKREPDTELHLLPKTKSTFDYCSCIKKIKTIAEHKINWHIQSFKVNLSEKKILNLLAFIKGFESIDFFGIFGETQTIQENKTKTSKMKELTSDIYKGSLSITQLKAIQNGVTINDNLRKRKERLRKQPSIIDRKIEHHAKNANVNEAWARCVDLPGLEDNISPSNTIKVIWRLVLNELQLSYSRSSDTTDTPYLNLRFGLITIDLALMTYGPAYQFSLGNIIMTDKMHTTPSGQYLDLLHSPFPSNVDVFSVLYRKVGANCPDYWTHFHGVETSLVADFGTLHMMLHQEAVRTLIQYWKYIREKITGNCNKNTVTITEKVKGYVLRAYDSYFKTKVPVPSGSIKFSHSGRLGDLNLRILDSDYDILNIHLQGLEADFLFRANERFVFRSFLSAIDVEHLSDVTLYKKILYADEDKVFEMKYVRFADITSGASSFKFTLGQLHVTFLYKLIIQLHRFVVNLGIGHYFQKILEKLNGSIENATETLKTNTKINLSVNIKGPVFLIPQKSSLPNVLIIDTGNFTIENFFKDNQTDTIENILIKLNEIVVSRGVFLLNATLGSQETIVEPMQIHLDVKRIIPKSKSIKTMTWEVDGLVDTINVTLGQKDTTMILAIISENSSEGTTDGNLSLSQQNSLDEDDLEQTKLRNLEVFFAEPKQKTLSVKISCEGVNMSLFFDSGELLSSPMRDLNHGLAKLQITEVASCCLVYTDRSMDGKLSVDTILIEEIGPESLVGFPGAGDNRILHSPLDENKNNNCMITVNKPPVIDITFHQNRTLDKSIDIIIGRLALILSVPFIEKLALFIIECLPKEADVCGVVNLGYVDVDQQLRSDFSETLRKCNLKQRMRKSLTIALRVNKPEFIFLIEGSVGSAAGKRRAFVTKAEILSDYSRHAQRQNFVLSLSGLHTLYSSLDGHSSSELYTILKQCDVELSKALTFEKGEKLSLNVSSLYLQFSNKVVYAINDVLNDIVEHFKVPECPEEVAPSLEQVEDLWEPKKVVLDYSNSETFRESHFFFGSNKSTNQSNPNTIINHQVFLMPKTELVVLFELETLPVLVFKSTVEMTVADWSSLLNANCDWTMQANYFNVGKQKWEPFIDPIVVEEKVFKPFEVNVKLFQDKAQEIAQCKGVKPQVSRNGRASITKAGRAKRGSDQSGCSDEGDDEEESGDDMVYLEPTNSFHGRNSRRVKTSLSTFLDDSDSENDDGSMEKLAAAISDLFTGDWNESDGSDIDNSTDSDPEPEEEQDDPKEPFDSSSSTHPLSKPFKKSLYLLIDCKDTLNLTITPSLIKTLTDLITLYSNKTLSIPIADNSQAINLINDIGPKSKVEIFEKEHLGTPASRISSSDCTLLISKTYEKEDSCPNSPTKENLLQDLDLDNDLGNDLDNDFNLQEAEAIKHNLQSEELNYDFATLNSLDFNNESTTELYEKINRYQMKIFIPHFYGLQTSCPRKDAQKLLRLHPCQVSTTIYYLAYRSSINKHGMQIVLSSPLSIRNETCFALSILYQPSVLQQLNLEPVGDVTNPFETTMRIAVLEPHETYNVPIHIAYHCKLFMQPAYAEGQYVPSQKGIWWKDLASDLDTGKLFTCQAKTSNEVFALRVVLERNLEVETLRHTVPNYIIRLLPAMVVRNFLPYSITVDILSQGHSQGQNEEKIILSSSKIEPGEKNAYYNLNTEIDNRVTFKLQTNTQTYIGHLTLNPHMDEKVIALVSDSEKSEINNLPLNIKSEKEDYYELLLYTSYWIVNKTQLSVQLKATSTNTIYKSNPNLTNDIANDIILFSFKRHTRQTLKLKVYDSEFSNEFGLDCPGTTGLVVCKDIVRKKRYAILLKISLSEMCPMTKIVTLLPCFVVSNLTTKKLRFMEHNEKTDLWIDLLQGHETPFWPETTSYQMYVKLQEQKVGSSQGFLFAARHRTLLKLNLPGVINALTVTVTGGIDGPFKVTFTDYKQGDAPLLIKNTCQELFLKVQQQNLTQVTLLSPLNELLYTWDDPLKGRLLLWNIYNNKASNGFVLDVERSSLMERYQYGQERIHFTCTNVPSSSDDDDDDSDSDTDISKKSKKSPKPKDKLTIFWVIYTEVTTNQKVLMFTQDSILFKDTLQKCFSESVTFETLLSLSGLGISLFTNKARTKNTKEHLYLGLNDSPATWEVNVGHKWKTLTLELASWIEDKYKSNQKRCQLKDYVHIDFEKMFMLKPFFAELRRSYNPAVYCQIRKGVNDLFLHMKIQNVQVDNKTLKNQEAILLCPLTSGNDLGGKDSAFVEVSLLKSNVTVKSVEVKIKDFQAQLQSQLLDDLSHFLKPKSSAYLFRKDMSRILGSKYSKSSKILKKIKQNLHVEQLKCSSASILLNVQSSHGSKLATWSSSMTKCQGHLFPPNMTPYMPSEGVKHRIINLELTHLQIRSLNSLGKFILGHFRTQFLQQYYSQVLGLQVLVNPYANQPTINPEVTGHIQDVTINSSNLLYSLRCLLGHINMSAIAVEQCVLEMLSGHHHFQRRPNLNPTLEHHGLPKIVNWSLRHFNPGVILALNQIIASKGGASGGHNGNGVGQSEGELFFRGTGKALVSLLTRHPDDKSNSVQVAMEALKRASLLGEPIRCHQRLTRYGNRYLGLGPFSIYESMGCHLLETVAGGRFKEDAYWTHAGIDRSGRGIVIVTLEHVLKVNKCRLWGPWELEWSLDLDEIISVPKVAHSKLVFNIRYESDRHKDDDLAANNDGKLLIDGDEEALGYLQGKIEQAIVVSMEDKAWTMN